MTMSEAFLSSAMRAHATASWRDVAMGTILLLGQLSAGIVTQTLLIIKTGERW